MRVILLLISIRYLKVTKCQFFLQLIFQTAVQCGLPTDQGINHLHYLRIATTFHFILMYDHDLFKPSAIAVMISQTLNFCAENFLFDKTITSSAIGVYIAMSIFFMANLYVIHLFITWVGMIFVEAETLRDGNEALLSNLKEGVVIVDELTNSIECINKAARDMKV